MNQEIATTEKIIQEERKKTGIVTSQYYFSFGSSAR